MEGKKRKRFSEEEDQKLIELVERFGILNWSRISREMENRTNRQCRDRWKFYLSPNVSKEPWSAEENALLHKLHSIYGSRWSVIESYLPHRSQAAISNHWKSGMKTATKKNEIQENQKITKKKKSEKNQKKLTEKKNEMNSNTEVISNQSEAS